MCVLGVSGEGITPTSHTYRCDILPPQGGGKNGEGLWSAHLPQLRYGILPPEGGGKRGEKF